MLLTLGTLLLSGVTVTLPMDATVRGTEIQLGEVAQLEGADAETLARLAAIELGYAPTPGYSRVLRIASIASLLARKAPDVELTFAGHAAVRVRPRTARIAAGALEAAARSALLGYAPDANLELYRPLADVLVPEDVDPPELHPRFMPDELTSGLITVPVEVLVGGAVYRTIWTSWTVQVYHTIPVLSRSVRAGETLDASYFERGRVRWTGAAQATSLDASLLDGAVAARDLRPGEALTGHDVHRPRLIEQGRTLTLAVRKGSITARVAAVALEPGAVGDVVRVRLLGGERELEGRVVRRDLVQVDLGR